MLTPEPSSYSYEFVLFCPFSLFSISLLFSSDSSLLSLFCSLSPAPSSTELSEDDNCSVKPCSDGTFSSTPVGFCCVSGWACSMTPYEHHHEEYNSLTCPNLCIQSGSSLLSKAASRRSK